MDIDPREMAGREEVDDQEGAYAQIVTREVDCPRVEPPALPMEHSTQQTRRTVKSDSKPWSLILQPALRSFCVRQLPGAQVLYLLLSAREKLIEELSWKLVMFLQDRIEHLNPVPQIELAGRFSLGIQQDALVTLEDDANSVFNFFRVKKKSRILPNRNDG